MRIGLGIPRQQAFIETTETSHRVWVAYNRDVTAGTYFELFATGVVDRVTVAPDGSMDVVRMRNERD